MDGPSNPSYQIETSPLFDRVWHKSNTCPERVLWLMVLVTYLNDLQHAYDVWRASTNGHTKEFRKKLLGMVDEGMSEEMGCICDLLDIEHQYFTAKVFKVSEGVDRFNGINRNTY